MQSKARLEIVFKGHARPLQLDLLWTIRTTSADSKRTFQSIDLVLRPLSLLKYASYETLLPHNVTQIRQVIEDPRANTPTVVISNQVICDFFLKVLQHCLHGGSRALSLIFPNTSGYIVRSDFIERRLVDCPIVDTAVGFVSPLQFVSRPDLAQLDLTGILAAATGALLLFTRNESQYQASFDHLLSELDARISFPWLLPQPIKRRRVAFVHKNKELWPDEPLVQAIPALGYDLVVVAAEGHWYNRPANRHLCAEFIPLDMTDNGRLAERIASALATSKHPVEAIFSFNEALHIPLANAAQLLSLPTTSPSICELCSDKYATRCLVDQNGQSFQSHLFPNATSLCSSIESETVNIQYPAIIKPSKGTSSEGIFKVGNKEELLEAASTTLGVTKKRDGGLVVETFIDGPEFDANFILCDGEILFFELLDDYPSAGDAQENSGLAASFMEIGMITPSRLPQPEVELIKAYLYMALLKAGFSWGIFHMEGRVRDSSVKFEMKDGVWDLHPNAKEDGARPPSCFLLEINARAPGISESIMSIRTYGIDYFGLQTLVSLRDSARLHALAQPFTYAHGGAQYNSEVVLFSPSQGGICQTPNACDEMIAREPELKSHIAVYHTLFKEGDSVPSPLSGTMVFLAIVVVYDRESRLETQKWANRVRAAFKMEIA